MRKAYSEHHFHKKKPVKVIFVIPEHFVAS